MVIKNRQIATIDQGYMLMIFVGTEDKVFYTVIYDEKPGTLKHFVRDIKSDKVWKVGKDNDPFTYPFLSEKGDILVVVSINTQFKTMNAYCGKDKDNYHLVKFLHNFPIGAMKLSPNGKVYLVMTPEGIRVGDI
jgi:hypothetical protein